MVASPGARARGDHAHGYGRARGHVRANRRGRAWLAPLYGFATFAAAGRLLGYWKV